MRSDEQEVKLRCLNYAIMARDGDIVETAQRYYDFVVGKNTAEVLAAAEQLAEIVLRARE